MEHRLGQDCSLQQRPYPGERDVTAVFINIPQTGDTVTLCDQVIGRVLETRIAGEATLPYRLIHLSKSPEALGLLRT